MSSWSSLNRATLRKHLQSTAARGATITYQTLAAEMNLEPPNTIHQLTTQLEETMREDALAGRPFIAALVVSKRPPYLPARGFFECAAVLGRISEADSEADFHARELAAAQDWWSKEPIGHRSEIPGDSKTP